MKEESVSQTEIDGESQTAGAVPESEAEPALEGKVQPLLCDRCGFEMFETNCKIICPNCGSRYDCSDLTIYFD